MLAILEDFLYGPQLTNNDASEIRPSWNVKPTQTINIAYTNSGSLFASTARWWFVPHWHKGNAKEWKATTFNAKIETAFEKPTFRTAWTSDRCIIPASGYYEWTGPKGKKLPWYITVEQNMPVFFFAGLHSKLHDGTETCTILTRAAEPELKDFHPRMPVILSTEQIEPWLNHSTENSHIIENYGLGWTGRFLMHRVAPLKRDDDGPELIELFELDV